MNKKEVSILNKINQTFIRTDNSLRKLDTMLVYKSKLGEKGKEYEGNKQLDPCFSAQTKSYTNNNIINYLVLKNIHFI